MLKAAAAPSEIKLRHICQRRQPRDHANVDASMNPALHSYDLAKAIESSAGGRANLEDFVAIDDAIASPTDGAVPPLNAQQILTSVLLRVGEGDRDAFRVLYGLTSSKIFGICVRVCRDHGNAQDRLHDVYVSIWNRSGAFDPSRGSAIAWMSTVARNRCIDWNRAEYVRRSQPIEGAWEIADPLPLVSETMLDGEAGIGLLACMATLQTNERDAIYGAFFDGLTHAEMAAVQGVPIGTMKSWVRRGLVKLRQAILTAGLDLQPLN